MNRTFRLWWAALVLLVLGLGCSSDKDKGINSNRDKPRASELGR